MNIYFSGIGGVGIGPLAEIALDAGFDVIGSDVETSLTTHNLQQNNITINFNQDGSFLKSSHQEKPIDWFIYTAALPADHPELVAAHELGIRTAKRDEFLAFIIKEKNLKLIAVVGTHGKTTTTGMLVWTMQQLGIPVSYSIGTTIKFGPSGKFDPNSEYFIYECDEFDRNFLHFNPYLALLPSIDYDHSDTYATNQDYLEAFRQFASGSEHVITWHDQHSEIFSNLNNTKVLQESEIKNNLKIAGYSNRRNATLVAKAIEYLEIKENIDKILEDFPGTDRRFEKLAENLYSDYGHHPVEIAATLQMAHELSDNIVLVYQPHQNIRQYEIKNQYTNQFELATKIYWLPTYLSREDPKLAILTPQELSQNVTNKSNVNVADFDDKLWADIAQARKNGALVLCMGAGKIDSWVREKLANNNLS